MPEPITNRPNEVWAAIPSAPGYWVSTHGRVRSPRGLLKPRRHDKVGHVAVVLPGRRDVLVHRLVAQAFLPPSSEPMVLHGDGVPNNNHVDNLRYGDKRANAADRKLHGGYDFTTRRVTVRLPDPTKLPPTSHPSCGTVSGATLHRRRGERPCPACTAAAREYSRDWYRRSQVTSG